MSATVAVKIEVYIGAAWVNLSADVLAGVTIHYGIDGNGPGDLVAGTGECQFSLDNSATNSGATLGYYSPSHASVRSGWTYGLPCKVTLTHSGTSTAYVKHYGKVRVIDPEPGQRWGRQVHVTSHDAMRDLAEADGRQVTLQVDQTEVQLIQAVIAALPTTAQPVATSYDTAVDSYPWAFDNIGEGAAALSLIADVARSALGYVYLTGPGTFTYQNRQTRAMVASSSTFTNTMVGLELPSALDTVFNRIRCTIHPKTVDTTPTYVLWSLTGPAPSIAPGQSTVIWGTYRDPENIQMPIGGTGHVDPLVASTDYVGNSASDGTGDDLTSSLSVTIDPFATTTKFTVTNNGTQEVYLTTLQVRGKRVRDFGPQAFEQYTAQTYGDRPYDHDMIYQDDPYVGSDAAVYIYQTYSTPASQVLGMEFAATTSALLTQALAREPGDVVTISETVTGASSVVAVIQSVDLDVRPRGLVWCRWGLAPQSALAAAWRLGTAGYSELGATTTLGF